jgi:hypothetical protein
LSSEPHMIGGIKTLHGALGSTSVHCLDWRPLK